MIRKTRTKSKLKKRDSKIKVNQDENQSTEVVPFDDTAPLLHDGAVASEGGAAGAAVPLRVRNSVHKKQLVDGKEKKEKDTAVSDSSKESDDDDYSISSESNSDSSEDENEKRDKFEAQGLTEEALLNRENSTQKADQARFGTMFYGYCLFQS